MNILLIWLSTSAASIFMEFTNEGRMFKDAADNGYLIDLNKFSKLNKELLGSKSSKTRLLELFIPIFNILGVLKRTFDYNQIRPLVLDALSSLDVLKEMTPSQKEKYEKKPSIFNAIKSNFVVSINELVEKKEEDKKYRDYLIKDDENGETKVEINKYDYSFKITGYAEKLSDEERNEYVANKLLNIEKSIDEVLEKGSDNPYYQKNSAAIKEELVKVREELLKLKETKEVKTKTLNKK